MKLEMKSIVQKGSGTGLLMFLGWLTYMISYLGKVNYSANITQIIDYFQVSKTEAGLVPTFFFFAYGAGQFINGTCCKYYNRRWFVSGSLALSSFLNFAVAVTPDFAIIKWLWMLNGLTLSVLWPTITQVLAENLPQRDMGKASVVMSTTVATGTLLIYGLSAVYAVFGQFKLAFYTAALTEFVAAVLWAVLYGKATSSAKLLKDSEGLPQEEPHQEARSQPVKAELSVWGVIAVLCVFAMGLHIAKDGLTTWVPAILKEKFGMTDALSILLTLLLPIVSIYGSVTAVKLHRKVPNYVTHGMLVSAAVALMIGIVLGAWSLNTAVVLLLVLLVVNVILANGNSLLTSVFPMMMSKKVNAGLSAGIINGFCYLGSTIGTYSLGFVADHFGWKAVFWTLLSTCVVASLVCGGYLIIRKLRK